MAVKDVKEFLGKWNMQDRVMEFEVSSATVEEAAVAAGCEGKQIAKTLSFKVGEQPILIVMAGDAKVDNRKYKETFQVKATMLKADEVPELIGHPVGGVCPFAIKDGVDVYLDISMKRFQTVFPACGSGSSVIELTIEELEECSGFTSWVDVSKGWE